MNDKRAPLDWAEIFGFGYRHGLRGYDKEDAKMDSEARAEYLRGYEQGQQDAQRREV